LFRDAGLETFRMIVLENDKVRQRTVHGLLELIEAERLGSNVDRQLLKSLLRMLSNLQIYHQVAFVTIFIVYSV
jgi:cullin 4